MKNLLLVAVAVLGFSLTSNAQQVGATVGMSFDKTQDIVGVNYTTKGGLFVGAAVADSNVTKGVVSLGYLSTKKYGYYQSVDFYANNKFKHGMSIGVKLNNFVPAVSITKGMTAFRVLVIF